MAIFTRQINGVMAIKKIRNILSLLLLMGFVGSAAGQLPETDAYLFTFFNNGVKVSLNSPRYISGMNPSGYNNQPAFNGPNELYLTTDLYDETFTELIKLDLLGQEYTRVTATDSISEYSPNPRAPNDMLSCIRVERDGKTQSLYQYPLDHSNAGSRLLKNMDNIGYHYWLSDTEVALFLVTDPVSLVIADIETGTVRLVSENVGRCLKQDSDGNLLYVHKVRTDLWYIKSYDLEQQASVILVKTLPDSEDFELLPDGTLLMGSGSVLKSINPSIDEYWKEAADLYDLGITKITRLAASRNNLVIVNQK